MTVEAKPNDGYRFVGWSTTTSSEDIVSSASIYSFTYQQKATIYALFETGTPDPISNMSATFTLPEAGTSADKPPVVTVPSGKHYEYYRDASVWFDESASSFLPDTTVFKAGETYCAGLVFLAKDGYAFTDNATVSFTNDSITYEQPMTDSNSLAVIIKFTVPASSDPDPSGQQQDEQQQQPADQPSQQQEQPQQQQEEPPAGQQQPPQEEQPQTESQPGQQEQQEQQEQQSDERIAFSKLKKVKVKAVSKKKIKVSWKKLSKKVRKEVKKIQIQVSTDHDFQNIVKTKLVSSKKTSCTISGLKKKTKYFIRIRAYTEKDGLKYVSEWVMKIKKTKK